MSRLARIDAPVMPHRLRNGRWSSSCPDCDWEDTDSHPTRERAVMFGNDHLCIPRIREPHRDGVVIVDTFDRPIDAFSRPWEAR